VLDLDETLVHLKDNKVFIRPGAQNFITIMSEHYELVLFTSATPTYADYIMQFIDPSHHIKLRLYRPHTTKADPFSIKNLQDLGRDLSKVIIIDNLKESFSLQQENGFHIKSWTGDDEDTELSKLVTGLIEIPYKNFSHVSEGLFSFLNNK
jgi:Dullard-like phosphatase family protein